MTPDDRLEMLKRLEATVSDDALFTRDEQYAVCELLCRCQDDIEVDRARAHVHRDRVGEESEAQRLIDKRRKALDRAMDGCDPPASLLEIFVPRHRQLEAEREDAGFMPGEA